ncbi:hypothetical protein C6P46_005693 [Rhodotorula mucilaginosa]|uniref:Uncharacterized protein n=1 Tax=Rhodotorula mucilaginosa TaxID=5537 RepID=A0A9P7B4T3_RHOMI|nr:hypothetical protein C6P46_005693 [Rhodotorula mucilaginosa]
MSRPRPSANQQRLTRVIVTLPFVIVSSWILYKRLVLGEQQRTMPRPGQPGADQHVLGTSLKAVWNRFGSSSLVSVATCPDADYLLLQSCIILACVSRELFKTPKTPPLHGPAPPSQPVVVSGTV